MNRHPSTTIAPIKPQGILPPVGARRATFSDVFKAGREAFPHIDGLVYITATRAYFQKTGDTTRYSVAITESEAATLGYTPWIA